MLLQLLESCEPTLAWTNDVYTLLCLVVDERIPNESSQELSERMACLNYQLTWKQCSERCKNLKVIPVPPRIAMVGVGQTEQTGLVQVNGHNLHVWIFSHKLSNVSQENTPHRHTHTQWERDSSAWLPSCPSFSIYHPSSPLSVSPRCCYGSGSTTLVSRIQWHTLYCDWLWAIQGWVCTRVRKGRGRRKRGW